MIKDVIIHKELWHAQRSPFDEEAEIKSGNKEGVEPGLQLRESHWVIVDLVGKGGRLRTVPVPAWCKGLVDVWLRHSSVSEGKVFRRVLKNGARQDAGVTAKVVWYAVKRCAKRPAQRIWHPTTFAAVAPASAMALEANSNRSSFC